MKKSKFGGNYPLDVKKIAMQYPDFFVDQINETYWAYGRDVEATMKWLNKCRTGEAHREMGVEFNGDYEELEEGYAGYTNEELEQMYREYYTEQYRP